MKIRLLVCLLTVSGITSAQEDKGIKWITGLNWEQVKEKAKNENKHIFLDIYATWCGPCKEMDKNVYNKDTVGKYFNEKFLSVRVQMDQTKTDNEEVRKWYADAEYLKRKLRVRSFPTFVFLNPDSVITGYEKGYHSIANFLKSGEAAVKPGQVYVNPYAEYEELMDDFEKGERNFKRMAYMFDIAQNKFRDAVAASAIAKEYTEYLNSVNKNELYTKENLIFLSALTSKSSSNWFSVFYPNFKRVNQIMRDENYAQRITDQIIQREIVLPFLGFKGGGLMMGGEAKTDKSERNWDELEKLINGKYNKYYTERNLLWAKVEWYDKKYNHLQLARCYFEFLDKYGMDSHDRTKFTWINHYAYSTCFKKIDDKSLLEKSIKWMKTVLALYPEYPPYLDTYACLLYKAGYEEEAIKYQQKAYQNALANNQESKAVGYKIILEKMSDRQPIL